MLARRLTQPVTARIASFRCAVDLAAPMPGDAVAPGAQRDRLVVRWLRACPVSAVVAGVRAGAGRAVAQGAAWGGARLAYEPVEVCTAAVGLPLHEKLFYTLGVPLRYVQVLADVAALCTRCRECPRLPKQRWCRACFNAYMRDYRARARHATASAAQSDNRPGSERDS